MGNIGPERRRIEVLPTHEPHREPGGAPAPAERPEPAREPEPAR